MVDPTSFYCNDYKNERPLSFETVREFQPININLLLYGNDMVDNTFNSSSFRAVHVYTKSTKRFDNT